jgi:hypothetical protein
MPVSIVTVPVKTYLWLRLVFRVVERLLPPHPAASQAQGHSSAMQPTPVVAHHHNRSGSLLAPAGVWAEATPNQSSPFRLRCCSLKSLHLSISTSLSPLTSSSTRLEDLTIRPHNPIFPLRRWTNPDTQSSRDRLSECQRSRPPPRPPSPVAESCLLSSQRLSRKPVAYTFFLQTLWIVVCQSGLNRQLIPCQELCR